MTDDLPASTFDEHAPVYDLLIDWPKRLANEAPFYRQLFEKVGVHKMLDAACGTGHHAAMFHSWGLAVEGADLSPGMIAECRSRFGEPPGLNWVVRSFDQPVQSPEPFDAVICVGNSLALAPDPAVVMQAMQVMLSALRRGGVCVIQVLNLWSLADGPITWQKCKRVRMGNGDHVLLKGVHRTDGRGFIDVIDLDVTGSTLASRYDAAQFEGLEADDLAGMAEAAGGEEIELWGSFEPAPYDRLRSLDLIFVCRRS